MIIKIISSLVAMSSNYKSSLSYLTNLIINDRHEIDY